MKLKEEAFAPGHLNRGPNFEFISNLIIEGNKLIDNYYQPIGKPVTTKKGEPIIVNPDDCEWLSQSFFRNEKTLYGLTCLLKSASIKIFLTPIKSEIDFASFDVISCYYAKDKNNFYYGPGAKSIKENVLNIYFDETYRKGWIALNPDKEDSTYAVWKSQNAISEDRIYWKGRLNKNLHSSLKRITPFYFCDDYQVYEFDLQKLKIVPGFDRSTLVYFNEIKNDSINGFVSDIHKPAHRHSRNEPINERYDYKTFASFFESNRKELSRDYWWYRMEQEKKS